MLREFPETSRREECPSRACSCKRQLARVAPPRLGLDIKRYDSVVNARATHGTIHARHKTLKTNSLRYVALLRDRRVELKLFRSTLSLSPTYSHSYRAQRAACLSLIMDTWTRFPLLGRNELFPWIRPSSFTLSSVLSHRPVRWRGSPRVAIRSWKS